MWSPSGRFGRYNIVLVSLLLLCAENERCRDVAFTAADSTVRNSKIITPHDILYIRIVVSGRIKKMVIGRSHLFVSVTYCFPRWATTHS